MNWQDTGFLLSKNKYSENNSIGEFYTKNHGKVTGVIYGSTSKKIKNYLFIGNKFHLNFNSKNDSKIGYFKLEIDQVITPIFMDDKHINENVFVLADKIKNLLSNNKWLLKFIFWELSFYKCIGYDIDFKDYVSEEIGANGNKKYFVESSKKNIPNFLIDKNYEIYDYAELLDGFKIVGDYLEKTILKTIGVNFPSSRSNLYASIKSLSLFDQQNMKL